MKVEIVTPVGVKFSGEAAGIVAPGATGDLGLLPGHRSMMSALRTGQAVVSVAGQEPIHLVIDGGYVHVVGGELVTITTELCEGWSDIDRDKARVAADHAREALTNAKEAVSTKAWQVKKHDLELAETRLRVVASRP